MFSKLRNFQGSLGFTWITGANILTAAIGAAFWLFFAATIPVEDYGKLNYIISFATLAFGLAALGMDTTILTFIPKGSVKLLYQANSLLLLAIIPAALILGLISGNATATILVVGIAFYYMSTIELLAKKQHKEYAVVAIGGKTGQVVASIALYYTIGLDGFLLGYAVAYLAFGYRYYISLRNFHFKFNELKTVAKFAVESYGFNTSKTMMFHLDKILIGTLFGYYILGYYQLSFQFFMLISLIPTSLFQYLLPQEAAGPSKTKVKFIGVALAVVVIVMTVFLAPLAVSSFFPQYSQSISSLQIISLAVLPLTFITLITTRMLAEGKSRKILVGGIIYVISQILLLILMGTIFGVDGLATSVVVALSVELLYLLSPIGKKNKRYSGWFS